MISPLDSRVCDANAEALGVSVRELMGSAGLRLRETVGSRHPGSSVLFVCGSGNNGGDGFAAASGMDPERVCVVLLCEPSRIRSDDARFYYSILECPIRAYDPSLLSEYDVIVDCALGTGISGAVKGPYRSFILDANASGKPIVSADVPSGLGTATAIIPECTVSFVDSKDGMTPENSGEIIVADIGMPYEAMGTVGPGDMLRYPVPDGRSHKGENGRLMVIAGGPYFGAPAMCAYSALRTGADIVRVFCPESVHDAVSCISPVLMITDLPGNRLTPASVGMLLSESEGYDAVLIGPGLGTADDTVEAVRAFASGCRVPMVIDADGLTAVAGERFSAPTVLTPHRGEFARLGGNTPEELARLMNAVVLLKGATDVVSDGTRTRTNRTGTPAMTGAGTGDVLAGCVAGLLSKGMSAFDAACLGAYITGKAGETAFQSKSYGLIATDVAECIPDVLREGLR
ncbi:MAG: NAD(P)H-hydrate dehydratase [Thermoplasmata archaeon]|nr:NAD(P)H-hydrate dehydratase [Thermoplasmata archaeon]